MKIVIIVHVQSATRCTIPDPQTQGGGIKYVTLGLEVSLPYSSTPETLH